MTWRRVATFALAYIVATVALVLAAHYLLTPVVCAGLLDMHATNLARALCS